MPTLRVLFLIVACVLFIVAALGWNPPRGSLTNAGLLFFAAAFLAG